MRSTKKLLQLMLDNQDLFRAGMCGWVERMQSYELISIDECNSLMIIIKENRPYRTKELFYFPSCEIEPRIEWIKERLSEINSEK